MKPTREAVSLPSVFVADSSDSNSQQATIPYPTRTVPMLRDVNLLLSKNEMAVQLDHGPIRQAQAMSINPRLPDTHKHAFASKIRDFHTCLLSGVGYSYRAGGPLDSFVSTAADSKMTFRPFNYAIASIAAFSVSLSSGNAAPADPSLAALHALETAPNAFSAVALARGNGAIFCTLGSKIKEKMVVDHERTAVLYSPEFRAWHGKGNVTNYVEIHSDINDLLYSMNNGRCSVAVENATNIIVIADALKQERMLFSVLPSPLQPAQLNDLYAKSLGFGSNADLMLATYMTANNEELQSFYKLGVTSKKAYDDALVRMRAAGYSQARHDLLAFLKDEAEGASRSLSATEIRDERNASAASAVK